MITVFHFNKNKYFYTKINTKYIRYQWITPENLDNAFLSI